MRREAALERAARQLFTQWHEQEEPLRRALRARAPAEQRAAVGRAVTALGVVRSLKRGPEEAAGTPRFEPVRECLYAVVRRPSGSDFVAVTDAIARAIAARYGGSSFLSLASKLLWIRFRHPIVIYDSLVRKELGTRAGDYAAYVDAWQRRYAVLEPQIVRVCERLATDTARSARTSPARRRHVAEEEWFRRRVLDIHLWLIGARRAAAR
jgi:hypothetical protein